MNRKLNTAELLLVVATVLFLVGYIVYPLLKLVVIARPNLEAVHLLTKKQVITACINSVLLSVLSVVVCALIGTYFAYTFHFKNIVLRKVLTMIILLPIAIPPITGVISYLFLLGDNGLVMKVFSIHNISFTGFKVILAIHLYSFYPLFYLFTGNALKAMDNSIVEAAHTLGGSKTKIFFSIILPQLRPALFGAALLTFMASLASFSAPFIFGGSQRFLTTEIYYAKINGDTALSALLSLLLAAISIGILLIFRLYGNDIPTVGRTKGTAKTMVRGTNGKLNAWPTVITILFCLIILLPIISLFIISLAPENFMMSDDLNFSLSWHNYLLLINNDDFLQPFFNSIKTSLVAVGFTVIIGLSVAYILHEWRFFGKSIFEAISTLPIWNTGDSDSHLPDFKFQSTHYFCF